MARLLVLDDLEENRDHLRSALTGAGHEVACVPDPLAAIAKVREFRPDLILATGSTAAIDVGEFVRRLRSDAEFGRTRLMFHFNHDHACPASLPEKTHLIRPLLTLPCDPTALAEAVARQLAAPAYDESHGADEDCACHSCSSPAPVPLAAVSTPAPSRLELLLQLGFDLAAASDSAALLRLYVSRIREIMGARFSILTTDSMPNSAALPVFHSGLDARQAAMVRRVRPTPSMVESVEKTGLPQFCHMLEEIGFEETPREAAASLVVFRVTAGEHHGWIFLSKKTDAAPFGAEDSALLRLSVELLAKNYELRSANERMSAQARQLADEAAHRDHRERELHRVGDLLARVIDGTNDAIYAKDLEGRYVLFNQAAARLTGIPADQTIGRTDSDLWAPETAEKIVRDDRRALETNQNIFVEEELAVQGGRIHVRTTKGPYRDASGRIIGIQGISTDITPQKLIEQSLRESEARYKRVIEDQTEVVFRVAADGKQLFANELFQQVFGSWDSNTGLGGWEKFLFPEDVPSVRVALAEMSADNPIIRLESRVKTVDERVRWMEFVFRGIYSEDRSLTEIQFVGRDTTSRKEAEARVAIQHEVIRIFARVTDERDALANFLQTICVTGCWSRGEIWLQADSENSVMEYEWVRDREEESNNDSSPTGHETGGKMSGLAELAMGACSDPIWFHDLHAELALQQAAIVPPEQLHGCVIVPLVFAKSFQGVMILFDKLHRRPDETYANSLKSLGSIAGQYLVRYRGENQLRLFRKLIDNSPDCIEVLDFETGRFLDVNERACNVHGYSREEYLRLCVEDLDPNVTGQPWKQHPNGPPNQSYSPFESVHRRKDGSIFPVEVMLSEATLDKRYLIAIVRDITERKALEDQFRQSQKMDALGRLAGGVAHDFNNLLTVIGGYGQMLMGLLTSGHPAQELIREVVEAGERAAALTRQLLAFSRKSIIDPKRIELMEVLRGIARMLERIVDDDAEIILLENCHSSAIMADAGQMEQVIVNLVVNARDAMRNGGQIRITVDQARVTEAEARRNLDARPGNHVRLTVTDTGHGMDQGTISRIFEPFFSTKGERGTGLGLSTVHGIITQLGGFIRAISQPGSGTSIVVHIPRADGDSVVIAPSKSESNIIRGTELILLVEDESGVRRLTKQLLLSFGYRVLEAENGVEGLEIIRREAGSLSLVITDVIMPKMGGGDLYHRAKAEHPGVKFLFVSGYTDDAILRQGIVEKGVSFLPKPFTPAELSREVRRIIDAADDRGRVKNPNHQSP